MIGLFCCLFMAFLGSQGPAAERLGVLDGISEPHSLGIIGENLTFLDGFTAHVWSLNPLEPKYAFAGQGEGPGQFKYWPRLAVRGDTVVGTDFLKTDYFTLQGDLLRTIPYSEFADFNTNMEMRLVPLGENSLRVTVDHDTSHRLIQLIRPDPYAHPYPLRGVV